MKKIISVLLALVLAVFCAVPTFAAEKTELEKRIQQTASYLQKTVKEPKISSIGGEWSIIGLARSDANVPDAYFEKYYDAVKDEVKQKKGILHGRKYTEYSRVALALTAIGADPCDVAGYDLLKPLEDVEKVTGQGINGPVWALIALDEKEICQKYVDLILSKQLTDGGWNLSGEGSADPDVTGMALQALVKYQDYAAVKTATEEALSYLSRMQDENGGFTSYGTNSVESIVQVIVALGELDIPLDDARFVKNENTLLDALLTYQNKDGSFSHTGDGESNLMASEQGLYGLVSAWRNAEKKNSLYDMDDVTISVAAKEPAKQQGEIGKSEILYLDRTFADIRGHEAQRKIETLASRGIISGMDETYFAPDATMTRAQFASIVVRALDLPQKAAAPFSDVKKGDWYYSAVGTAYHYGLVSGKTAATFDPDGTITRQEAASMVTRAAKLCGMNTEMTEYAMQNTLTLFEDYPSVSGWAKEGVAFCYSRNILDQSDWNIEPTRNITRSEVAEMLYHLLEQAELL